MADRSASLTERPASTSSSSSLWRLYPGVKYANGRVCACQNFDPILIKHANNFHTPIGEDGACSVTAWLANRKDPVLPAFLTALGRSL